MRVGFTVIAAMAAMFATQQLNATLVTSVTLNGGSFSGGVFTSNAQVWDTIVNGNWVLGITNPSVGAAFRNASDTTLTPPIPTGTYWSYNEPTSFGSAIQLTVAFDTGTQVAVFSTGNLANAGEVWTRLSGSTQLGVTSTGQTQLNRVMSGEYLVPGGSSDSVLQLDLGPAATVPEPATLSLIGGGLLIVALQRRRASRA